MKSVYIKECILVVVHQKNTVCIVVSIIITAWPLMCGRSRYIVHESATQLYEGNVPRKHITEETAIES